MIGSPAVYATELKNPLTDVGASDGPTALRATGRVRASGTCRLGQMDALMRPVSPVASAGQRNSLVERLRW